MIETEIRTLIDDLGAIESELDHLGFKFEHETVQTDVTLDRAGGEIFRSGRKIRIRSEGDRHELTLKGRMRNLGDASSRVESSILLPPEEVEPVIAFFSDLGFPPLFTVRKIRRTHVQGEMTVTLDRWPIIGWMIEIEGPADEIQHAAAKLTVALPFKGYRLAELFRIVSQRRGLPLEALKAEYEHETGEKIGNIEFLF